MSEPLVPLSDLDYGLEEEEAVLRVLRSRWISMGPEVSAFEQEFAAMLDAKHAIAVSSATAALHLALLALGVGEGHEVLQPALNFVAAANVTMVVGARPVFADSVSLDEPTVDPREVERLITPQTKAILVMHYGGYLCRMDELYTICRRHGVALVQDACHAVGAHYSSTHIESTERSTYAVDDLSCFSFFANKNLATGEGGMIATNRDDLADRLRLLRSHGMTTLTWQRHRGHASAYDVIAHGLNYRMDELHAALGRTQLAKLRRNNQRRAAIVSAYRCQLSDLPHWKIPFADYRGYSSHHLMAVLAPDAASRSHTVETLRCNGVQTSLHYPCVPSFEAFGHNNCNDFGKSMEFAKRVITLPLYPTMTDEQVAYVCKLLIESAQ